MGADEQIHHLGNCGQVQFLGLAGADHIIHPQGHILGRIGAEGPGLDKQPGQISILQIQIQLGPIIESQLAVQDIRTLGGGIHQLMPLHNGIKIFLLCGKGVIHSFRE
ncbi:hypothetical protein D3C75_950330 [compost metagenome]